MIMEWLKKLDFKPEEAIIGGFLVYFLVHWTPHVYFIPLFNFFPNLIQEIIWPVLAIIALLLLFTVKNHRFYVLCFISALLFFDLNKYSSMLAFRYFPTLVALGYVFVANLDERQKKTSAVLILFCVYFFSAIHKINPAYLSGAEFYQYSDFLVLFHKKFPNLHLPFGHWVGKGLAYGSVVVELLIAFLLLMRTRLAIYAVVFFLLFLALINSGVVFVYFFFLPLLFMINPNWSKYFSEHKTLKYLNNPIVWGGLFWLCQNFYSSFVKEFFTNTLWVIILIVLHIVMIVKERKHCLLSANEHEFSFSIRGTLIPIVLAFLFIGSFYFIPSPYGFKMYSGKRFEGTSHVLEVYAPKSCYFLGQKYIFSRAVDTRLDFIGTHSCKIIFPTRSGLKAVIEEVCRDDSSTKMGLDKANVQCL